MNPYLAQQIQAQRYASFIEEANRHRMLVSLLRERPVKQPIESAIAVLIFRVGYWLRVNLAASFF